MSLVKADDASLQVRVRKSIIPTDVRDGSWPFSNSGRAVTQKVEMLFAHLKRILKLDRLRLRGPNGARDEFLLAAPPKTSGS